MPRNAEFPAGQRTGRAFPGQGRISKAGCQFPLDLGPALHHRQRHQSHLIVSSSVLGMSFSKRDPREKVESAKIHLSSDL